MEQSMTFDYGRMSDRGQKRPENEDALFVPANLNEVQEQGALFLIADGMGSYGNGKLAATSTISRLTDYYYSGHQPIEQALEAANRDVYAMAQSNPQYDGMGTTIVGVLANFDSRFQVFNVGDSRAYFLRNGKIELISKDHSVVAKRAEDEGITWEEAAKRGKANQLTRSIGRRSEVKAEFLDPQTKQILGGSDRLKIGDALVLCCDGLWRDIKPDEIQRTVRKARSAQAASEELVKMANERGGADNITVVVIKCVPAGTVVPVEQPQPTAASAAVATTATPRTPAKKKMPLPLPLLLGGLGVVAVLIVASIVLTNSGPAAPPPSQAAVIQSTPIKIAASTPLPEPTATPTASAPVLEGQYTSLVIINANSESYANTQDVTLKWESPQGVSMLGPDQKYVVWINYQDATGQTKEISLTTTNPQIALPRDQFFVNGNGEPLGKEGFYQWAVAVVSGTVEEISPRTKPLYEFFWKVNPPTLVPVTPSRGTPPSAPAVAGASPTPAVTPTVDCHGQFWNPEMNRCQGGDPKPGSNPNPPPNTGG